MTKLRLLLTVLAAIAVGVLVIFWGDLLDDGGPDSEDKPLSGQDSQNVETVVSINQARWINSVLSLSGQNSATSKTIITTGEDRLAQLDVQADGTWQASLDLSQRLAGTGESIILPIDFATQLIDGRIVYSDQAIRIIRRAEPTPQREVEAQKNTAGNRASDTAIIRIEPGKPTQIIQSVFTPVLTGDLVLYAVDYDNTGGLIISGNLSQAGRIRVFADEIVLGETGRDEQGNWQLVSTTQLPIGQYVLKLVAFNPNAEIIGELTVPFQRYATDKGQSDDQALRMKYAAEHWHMSRDLFGGGQQHTIIYNGDFYGDNAALNDN